MKKTNNILSSFFLLNTNRSFPELDGIRAWAIAMVFMAHVHSWILNIASEIPFSTRFIDGIRQFVYYFPFIGAAGGAGGVDLFFMLSGFLIYISIHKKNRTTFQFLSNRIRRLFPVHITLIVGLLVSLPLIDSLLNIFLLSTFFPSFVNAHPITWTLSYEIIFYGLCALWFIHFKNEKKLQTWLAFFVVAILVYASGWILNRPLLHIGINFIETHRFISFFFGLGLGKLYFLNKDHWKSASKLFEYGMIPAIILTLVFFYTIDIIPKSDHNIQIFTYLDYLILDIGYFLILGALLLNRDNFLKKIFRNTYIRIIGVISYSMYLFHYSYALPFTKSILGGIPTIQLRILLFLPVSFAITVIFSIFFFHYLEKPYFKKSELIPKA